MDIVEALQESVSTHPERAALVYSGESYSYRRLEQKASAVAKALESNGAGENDRVIVSGPNTPKMLLGILGTWFNGSTCVHVNPKLETEDFRYYLEDSNADAFLFHHSIEKKIKDLRGEVDTFLDMEEALDKTPGEYSTGGQDLVSITYTSGTTDKPKAVSFTHERLLHGTMILVVEVLKALEMENPIKEEVEERRQNGPESFSESTLEKFIQEAPWRGKRHGIIYPLYHVSGTNPSLATLISGGTVVYPENRDPSTVMNALESEEVNLTGGVGTQLSDLVEEKKRDQYDLSSLEYVHTAGGLITDEVMQNVLQELCGNLCHEYASSETLEISYSLDGSGSLGRPTCLQDVRVVKPGTLEEVEPGESGEAVVSTDGPTVFQGYLGRPEETKKAIRDGWYMTGDIVEMDEDGRLWFRGRRDDLIVSGGENISPAEVENALVSHQKVESAGVVGIEDDRWGNRVVAFVEGEASEEELDEHLRDGDLADFKRPKEYIFVDSMPVKETGGVDRRRLREYYNRKYLTV